MKGLLIYLRIKNDPKNIDKLWDFIYKNNTHKYIQTASSQSHSMGDKATDKNGIVYGHAYGILDA